MPWLAYGTLMRCCLQPRIWATADLWRVAVPHPRGVAQWRIPVQPV